MTWGEVQIASLQKMFLLDDAEGVNDLPGIASDDENRQMLAAMPTAANEGLLRMATSRNGFRKMTDAVLWCPENLLSVSFDRFELTDSDKPFIAGGAHAYSFQLYGSTAVCEIDVYNGSFWESVATIANDGMQNMFNAYRGVIPNAQGEEVRLRFSGGSGCKAQYVALFAEEYPTAQAVPAYAPYTRVYLPGMIPDYMQMVPGGFKPVGRSARVAYSIDASDYLTLPYGAKMHYQLEYKSRPTLITHETDADYVLDIPEEYSVLLPLYIASQLYKDTDISQATIYRNEFEAALAVIDATSPERTPEQFYSVGGIW